MLRNIFVLVGFLLNVFYAQPVFAAVGAIDSATAPTNAAIDSALKELKVRSPDRYRRILEMRESNPQLFSQNILEVSREQERLDRLRRQIPENYRLQIAMWNNREKLRSLVEEYRSESDVSGREIIESQMDNMLSEQYDIRNQMRINRLKRAEKRLMEMKQELRQEASTGKNKFIAEWKPKLLAKPLKKAQ